MVFLQARPRQARVNRRTAGRRSGGGGSSHETAAVPWTPASSSSPQGCRRMRAIRGVQCCFFLSIATMVTWKQQQQQRRADFSLVFYRGFSPCVQCQNFI